MTHFDRYFVSVHSSLNEFDYFDSLEGSRE
jgi:hypothetical protein